MEESLLLDANLSEVYVRLEMTVACLAHEQMMRRESMASKSRWNLGDDGRVENAQLERGHCIALMSQLD